MNLQEWQRLAQRLGDSWGRTMREGQVATWFLELQGHRADDVQMAVVTLARTEDRMPSLARLLSATRKAKSDWMKGEPVLTTPPGQLPQGVAAIVHSSNFADIAVMVNDQGYLPEGIEITSVEGRLPAYMPAKVPA